MSVTVRTVGVLVPVRNEEALLPRCFDGLRTAVDHLGRYRPNVEVTVIVALDHCTDGSEAIAARSGFEVVSSRIVGVGAARGAAASYALSRSDSSAPDNLWLACTDADSVVPPNWLTHQVSLAGADVVIGSVRPYPGDLDPDRDSAWTRTHDAGQSIGHVHGANLGIRASSYLAAGGFEAVTEHEDVDLVERAKNTGAVVRPSDEHCVLTSGRLRGRTAGGYAGHLRDQLVPLADLFSDVDMAR